MLVNTNRNSGNVLSIECWQRIYFITSNTNRLFPKCVINWML